MTKKKFLKSFNLDKEIFEILSGYAERRHVSRSAAIRLLILENCMEESS